MWWIRELTRAKAGTVGYAGRSKTGAQRAFNQGLAWNSSEVQKFIAK